MQRLAQWHCCQARSCLRSQSYTRAVAVHSAGPPHVPAHVSELPSSRFQVTAKEVTANVSSNEVACYNPAICQDTCTCYVR